MEIQELTVAEEKQKVVRQILEGLPEWFGIAEAREEYIAQSAGQPCFADRKSTRLNSSHPTTSRMPSSA